MKKTLHVATLALMFSAAPAAISQTANAPTNRRTVAAAPANAELLKLLRVGMPESVVLKKIHDTTAKFDTSTDALIALKAAGATKAELDAVLAHDETSTATPAAAKPAPSAPAPATTVNQPLAEKQATPTATAQPPAEPPAPEPKGPPFRWINRAPGGEDLFYGVVHISKDGSTVTGQTWRTTGTQTESNDYIWTEAGGTQNLKSFGFMQGVEFEGISDDGSVLAMSYGGDKVFLWKRNGGLQNTASIEALGPILSLKLSADGSVIVGSYSKWVGNKLFVRLFRWTQAGGAEDLAQRGSITVFTISPDASTAAGFFSAGSDAPTHGFRWTKASGFQDLGLDFYPTSVSDDGATIWGNVAVGAAHHAAQWTQAGGLQEVNANNADLVSNPFTPPAGMVAAPLASSTDHSVILGLLGEDVADPAKSYEKARLYLWTKAGGLQNLGTFGGKAVQGVAVSADGSVIAGMVRGFDGSLSQFVSPASRLVAASRENKDAQQERMDKVLASGRPAQIYALAGDFEDEHRADLAAKLYQALIERFPDDPYAAKAIDKKDAARSLAKQQQAAQQQQARQQQASAAHDQAIADCQSRCSDKYDSCNDAKDRRTASTLANGIVGALTKNSAAMNRTMADASDEDSNSGACDQERTNCEATCH